MGDKPVSCKFFPHWNIPIYCIPCFTSCTELLSVTSARQIEGRVWWQAYLSSSEILSNQARQNITKNYCETLHCCACFVDYRGVREGQNNCLLVISTGSTFKSSNPFHMNIFSGIKCWLYQSALKKEENKMP